MKKQPPKPSLKPNDALALERTRLANERTFLAYFRTFIVFLSSGFAILKLSALNRLKFTESHISKVIQNSG